MQCPLRSVRPTPSSKLTKVEGLQVLPGDLLWLMGQPTANQANSLIPSGQPPISPRQLTVSYKLRNQESLLTFTIQKNVNSYASATVVLKYSDPFPFLRIIEGSQRLFIMWVIFVSSYHIRNQSGEIHVFA